MRVRLCAIALTAGLSIPLSAAAQQAMQPPTTEVAEQTVEPATAEPAAAASATAVTDADAHTDQATAAAPPAPEAEAEAEATTAATHGTVGPAPADKAQIVFFRPSKMLGGAIGFKVREGEQELGKLRSGNYFIYLAEPGTHEYTVHSEAKDVLTMEVEAGETYFVQGTISMGVLAGRPNLSPSDEATFTAIASKLKLRE